MTFWKTASFKALQKSWYRRLKSSGFQDAEDLVGGELVLKQVAAHPYRGSDELTRVTKEAYYRLLGNHVNQERFESEIDRTILTMFSEGRKIKHICEELIRKGMKRDRYTVRVRIRIYEMKWGLREYTPRQLNQKVK